MASVACVIDNSLSVHPVHPILLSSVAFRCSVLYEHFINASYLGSELRTIYYLCGAVLT